MRAPRRQRSQRASAQRRRPPARGDAHPRPRARRPPARPPSPAAAPEHRSAWRGDAVDRRRRCGVVEPRRSAPAVRAARRQMEAERPATVPKTLARSRQATGGHFPLRSTRCGVHGELRRQGQTSPVGGEIASAGLHGALAARPPSPPAPPAPPRLPPPPAPPASRTPPTECEPRGGSAGEIGTLADALIAWRGGAEDRP